jgi:5'-3' exonuclease
VQIPLITQVLIAAGIALAEHEGYEADDVIATLAARAAQPVDVVTGDRDLFQLVDDEAQVRVLYIARGVGNHERVDDAWVHAKYGVHAAQYADYATLRGDASDGLPGVKGVGEKTAAGLLERYGDLVGIVEAAADPGSGMAPGPRAKILAALDYLAAAPRVVAVARDLPVDRDGTALPSAPAHPERVAELAQRFNLAGPAERLTRALAARAD